MAIHDTFTADTRTSSAEDTLTALDPATGDTIGTVPITMPQRIPEIVAQARQAQRVWEDLPFAERARVLNLLRDTVVKRAEEIADTVSRGMGKPRVDALVGDVGLVLDELAEYINHGAGSSPTSQWMFPPSSGPASGPWSAMFRAGSCV